MKITNKLGLPEPLVRAVQNDPYSRGDADFSVTDLLKSPRQLWLTRRHEDEIAVDVADRIWALLGQAIHAILERAGMDNAFVEERLYWTVLGRKISGATDLFTTEGLWDWKVTSAWTLVYKSRFEEWERQLNMYDFLFHKAGFDSPRLRIGTLLRDWSRTQALRSNDYPRHNAVPVQVKQWTHDQQHEFILARVKRLIDAESLPDDDLPHCTDEEMWAQPTKYAVMKEGRKSAVKVCDTEQVAQQIISEQKDPAKHRIELRPGTRNRCADYCDAAPYCNQWKAYLETQSGTEADTDESEPAAA